MHFLNTVIEQIDHLGENLRSQVDERLEVLDTALDGLGENPEGENQRPALILDEISSLTRVPLRLEADRMQELVDDPRSLSAELRAQVEASVVSTNISRLASTIEFRLGKSTRARPG